jgi:hypothetical protein
VKQYVILRLATGIFFCCRFCDFQVKVQHRYGSARTVAASAINEHIATVHSEGRP